MMLSIRRLTAAEKADRDDASADRYEELFDEIAEQERAEYDAQFGTEFQAKHPYRRDTARIHETVCRRLHAEGLDFQESRADA